MGNHQCKFENHDRLRAAMIELLYSPKGLAIWERYARMRDQPRTPVTREELEQARARVAKLRDASKASQPSNHAFSCTPGFAVEGLETLPHGLHPASAAHDLEKLKDGDRCGHREDGSQAYGQGIHFQDDRAQP